MKTRRFVAGTVGIMVLSMGLLLMSANPGAQAAPPNNPGNPNQAILDKLDQILAAITGAAGQGNHTLRWDTNNPLESRYVIAFPGAVLDKNTGLVWEQAPDAGSNDWIVAIGACISKEVGGVNGWRLPSVVELRSVFDFSSLANVFTGVNQEGASYWSATTSAIDPSFAWSVNFFKGNAGFEKKTSPFMWWCVRGPMQESVY